MRLYGAMVVVLLLLADIGLSTPSIALPLFSVPVGELLFFWILPGKTALTRSRVS